MTFWLPQAETALARELHKSLVDRLRLFIPKAPAIGRGARRPTGVAGTGQAINTSSPDADGALSLEGQFDLPFDEGDLTHRHHGTPPFQTCPGGSAP